MLGMLPHGTLPSAFLGSGPTGRQEVRERRADHQPKAYSERVSKIMG